MNCFFHAASSSSVFVCVCIWYFSPTCVIQQCAVKNVTTMWQIPVKNTRISSESQSEADPFGPYAGSLPPQFVTSLALLSKFQHINIHQYSFNLWKVGYWRWEMFSFFFFSFRVCLTPLINSFSVPVCDYRRRGGEKVWIYADWQKE